jgi:hypothetical protein
MGLLSVDEASEYSNIYEDERNLEKRDIVLWPGIDRGSFG